MGEIFELIAGVIQQAGPEVTSAGVVLTGGGALLDGVEALGRELLRAQVRVAAPTGPIMGILDDFRGPAQAAVLGLFSWVARGLDEAGIAEEPAAGLPGRIFGGMRSALGRIRG